MASLLTIELLLYAVIVTYPQYGFAMTGNRFTLAFFPEGLKNGFGTVNNFLYMSSTKSGTCSVCYYDGTRNTFRVSLFVGSVVETSLSDVTQMNNTGPAVEPKAIYVNCTEYITLHAYNKYTRGRCTAEPYLVLPEHTLSSRYLVPSVNDSAFIGVVALHDNTHISLYLGSSCPQMYRNKIFGSGDVLNVTLRYGEVFRFGPMRAVNEPNPCNLGGSLVTSNRQIAVFSGSTYYSTLGPLVTQLPPTSAFTKTVIVPAFDRANMIIRIITNNDDTHVEMISELNTQIEQYYKKMDAKEYFDRVFEKGVNVIVSANKPVMVTQRFTHHRYGVGKNEYGYAGKGSLMFIPGTVQYENSFLIKSFYTSGTYFPNVTVVTESSATDDVRVDGIVPTHVTWTALSSMPYSVGRFQLQDTHTHNISCSSPMLVRVDVEAGWFQSYSYIAGYKLNPSDAEMVDGEEMSTLVDGEEMSTLIHGEETPSLIDGEETSTLIDGEETSTLINGEETSTLVIVVAVCGVLGILLLTILVICIIVVKKFLEVRKNDASNANQPNDHYDNIGPPHDTQPLGHFGDVESQEQDNTSHMPGGAQGGNGDDTHHYERVDYDELHINDINAGTQQYEVRISEDDGGYLRPLNTNGTAEAQVQDNTQRGHDDVDNGGYLHPLNTNGTAEAQVQDNTQRGHDDVDDGGYLHPLNTNGTAEAQVQDNTQRGHDDVDNGGYLHPLNTNGTAEAQVQDNTQRGHDDVDDGGYLHPLNTNGTAEAQVQDNTQRGHDDVDDGGYLHPLNTNGTAEAQVQDNTQRGHDDVDDGGYLHPLNTNGTAEAQVQGNVLLAYDDVDDGGYLLPINT